VARRSAQDARPDALVTVEDRFARLVGRQASEADARACTDYVMRSV